MDGRDARRGEAACSSPLGLVFVSAPGLRPTPTSRLYARAVRAPSWIRRGARRSDAVLAAVFLAISLVQVALAPVRTLWLEDSTWFGLVLALVSVLPLAWRRDHPVAAAMAGASLWWVPTDRFLVLGYVCCAFLFFSVGRHARQWRALACGWGLASGTAGMVAIDQVSSRLQPLLLEHDVRAGLAGITLPAGETLLAIAGFWSFVLVPYAVGAVMAAEQRRAEQRLEEDREVIRRQATQSERERIVRDLHDVVGHEVTLMAIQSEAAAQALVLAPERAGEPLAAVRATAHRAHRELRAILDLLGEGEVAVNADGRGLRDLTERAASSGIANELRVTGTPWADAPQHWLAVNRVVQECLTNAGKHAPGESVDLRVDWTDAGVRVTASNRCRPGSDDRPGHGLPGMAERARSLNGTFTAGVRDERFQVEVWLPSSAAEPR